MKTLNQCKIEIAKKYNLAYYGDADVYERANKLADEVAELYASEVNKPPVYGQWIDVKERLPEYNQRVLTYNPTNEISIEEIRVIMYGSVSGGFPSSVTKWMPLPPSPGSVDVEEKKECKCERDDCWQDSNGDIHCNKKVDGLGDSSGSAENQEQLWKEVFHQSGSRMDFMQFLQKHFTITRKP